MIVVCRARNTYLLIYLAIMQVGITETSIMYYIKLYVHCGSVLGGADLNDVVSKTCWVYLCVFEQLRVSNSIEGPLDGGLMPVLCTVILRD